MSNGIRVLLCYKEQKKIVEVVSGNGQYLVKLAEEAFALNSKPVLQYFDKDFEEWVDLTDDYTPSNKEKIRIVQGEEQSASTMLEDKVNNSVWYWVKIEP